MTPLQQVCPAMHCDALLRRGWQHDGRWPTNPDMPGPMPQKVPLSL